MCQKYVKVCKKRVHGKGGQLYIDPWKSVLVHSILHYFLVPTRSIFGSDGFWSPLSKADLSASVANFLRRQEVTANTSSKG